MFIYQEENETGKGRTKGNFTPKWFNTTEKEQVFILYLWIQWSTGLDNNRLGHIFLQNNKAVSPLPYYII